MKKIFKLSFIVLTFLGFGVSQSMADWSAGINANAGLFDASGSERIGSTGTQTTTETNTAGATALFMYPSIFVEADLGVVSVGVDYIPVSVETDEASRTDYDLGGYASSVTNKVKVDIKNHVTMYANLKSDAGAYLKVGVSYMTVKTDENLGTGSDYGNDDVIGGHIGIGYQHDLADAFVRVGLGYSVYEEISIDNGSNSANTNTVNAEIEGAIATISIGKSF